MIAGLTFFLALLSLTVSFSAQSENLIEALTGKDFNQIGLLNPYLAP
jgi:hypothetical protein